MCVSYLKASIVDLSVFKGYDMNKKCLFQERNDGAAPSILTNTVQAGARGNLATRPEPDGNCMASSKF